MSFRILKMWKSPSSMHTQPEALISCITSAWQLGDVGCAVLPSLLIFRIQCWMSLRMQSRTWKTRVSSIFLQA